MEEFGSAPSSQLLILMAIPLTGVILFGVFLVVAIGRRKKKSQMKLGIPPKLPQPPKAPPPLAKEAATISTTIPPPIHQPLSASNEDLDLGVLLSNLQGEPAMRDQQKSTNPKKEAPLERITNWPTETARSFQPAETGELLRLLRDAQSGQLIVEIAGQRYTKLADIADKEIGQFILKLAAHLLAFTNGVILSEIGMKSLGVPKVGKVPNPIGRPESSATPPPVKVSPAAPAKIEPQQSEQRLSTSTPSPEVEATLLASLRNPSPQPAPPPPKKGGIFGLGGTSAAPAPLPGFNLAQEINEIVQARLRYSPLTNTHQIEVTSDLGGGIRIKVDHQYYSSPEDIPNPEIKELIKASIKEWERK